MLSTFEQRHIILCGSFWHLWLGYKVILCDFFFSIHVSVCGACICSDRDEHSGENACGGQNQSGQRWFTLGVFLRGSPPYVLRQSSARKKQQLTVLARLLGQWALGIHCLCLNPSVLVFQMSPPHPVLFLKCRYGGFKHRSSCFYSRLPQLLLSDFLCRASWDCLWPKQLFCVALLCLSY